jgi:hypothetical protein
LPRKLSLAEVSKLLSMGLNDINIGLASSNQFGIGDGGVVLSLGSAGNFIAAWYCLLPIDFLKYNALNRNQNNTMMRENRCSSVQAFMNSHVWFGVVNTQC